MIGRFLREIGRTWFTGFLYILAGLGYIFFYLLLAVRVMQKFLGKALLVVLLLLVIAVGAGYYIGFHAPESAVGAEIEYTVKKGATYYSVGNDLQKAGVIKNSKAFYYYSRYKKLSGLKAGKYKLNLNDGPLRTITKLQGAPIVDELRFTVPEGRTIEQTAGIIASQFSIDSATFASLCYDSLFIDELGFETVTTLEGMLFPETYSFPKGSDEKRIIRKMVSQFKKIYASIPESDKTQTMTPNEILTMASVVEKESQAAHERSRIAAVFYNRLKRGIPLGADATVRFSIKKFKGPLRVSELNNNSPYNTRKFKGLPPGPICSPGAAAIEAALRPIESKELFFVAKWDGSGEHYFSKTNAEHNRMKMKIRRQNRDKANW